jgi:ArsR family transcriptional regulator
MMESIIWMRNARLRRSVPSPRKPGSRCSVCWSLAARAGLPAGALAERLGVQPSLLSFHLAQLVHAGLITQRRLSRQLIYSAEYSAMNALLAYLTENCCGQGTACVPVCNPGDTVTKGEADETLSCARQC